MILTYSCCTKKYFFTKVGSQFTASCNHSSSMYNNLTFKRAYAYVTLAIRHVAWHMFKHIFLKIILKFWFHDGLVV